MRDLSLPFTRICPWTHLSTTSGVPDYQCKNVIGNQNDVCHNVRRKHSYRIFTLTRICRSSLLSGRNVCWPRRVMPPGESRWVYWRDRQTDGRQNITLRLPLDAASIIINDISRYRRHRRHHRSRRDNTINVCCKWKATLQHHQTVNTHYYKGARRTQLRQSSATWSLATGWHN